jgi:hypothetical protein
MSLAAYPSAAWMAAPVIAPMTASAHWGQVPLASAAMVRPSLAQNRMQRGAGLPALAGVRRLFRYARARGAGKMQARTGTPVKGTRLRSADAH